MVRLSTWHEFETMRRGLEEIDRKSDFGIMNWDIKRDLLVLMQCSFSLELYKNEFYVQYFIISMWNLAMNWTRLQKKKSKSGWREWNQQVEFQICSSSFRYLYGEFIQNVIAITILYRRPHSFQLVQATIQKNSLSVKVKKITLWWKMFKYKFKKQNGFPYSWIIASQPSVARIIIIIEILFAFHAQPTLSLLPQSITASRSRTNDKNGKQQKSDNDEEGRQEKKMISSNENDFFF